MTLTRTLFFLLVIFEQGVVILAWKLIHQEYRKHRFRIQWQPSCNFSVSCFLCDCKISVYQTLLMMQYHSRASVLNPVIVLSVPYCLSFCSFLIFVLFLFFRILIVSSNICNHHSSEIYSWLNLISMMLGSNNRNCRVVNATDVHNFISTNTI
jgi:hypothetical protein